MQLAFNETLSRTEGFNLFPGLPSLRLKVTFFNCIFIIASMFLSQNISQRISSQFKPESSILVGNYKKAKGGKCINALCKAITLHIATSQESNQKKTGETFA